MPAPILIEGMSLFGLEHSNRDFRDPANWKKNIFNNAFPVSLAAWMGEQSMDGVYLKLDSELHVVKDKISMEALFGLRQLSPNLHYEFEVAYTDYVSLLAHRLPRIDLVTFDTATKRPMRGLEIKLTALPDSTTAHLPKAQHGCEIVVRPDSIVYIALSIAAAYVNEQDQLRSLLEPVCSSIIDWKSEAHVLKYLPDMVAALNQVMLNKLDDQHPLVLQPIWRTIGQKLILDDQCFDVFVWSNYAFTRLFMTNTASATDIGRPTRTIIWLIKMLHDFACVGRFNAKYITNELTYGKRNDKAFSITGILTQPLMACVELSIPRVRKEVVRDIILGGGQDHLQPERRLDAAILTTSGLLPQHIFTPGTMELPTVLDEPLEAAE